MKKIFSFVFAAFMATTLSFAQNDIEQSLELAKKKTQLDDFNKKSLNEKATKDARKEAKKLTKEGWTVPVGELSVEKQIMRGHLMREELMTNDKGLTVNKYFFGHGLNIGGSYNAAYATARNAAILDIASQIKTRIVSIMQAKIDNNQQTAITTQSIDKFNSRAKAIVDENLTDLTPVSTVYRVTKNNMYEVMVDIAINKADFQARIQDKLREQMEEEGDELLESIQNEDF